MLFLEHCDGCGFAGSVAFQGSLKREILMESRRQVGQGPGAIVELRVRLGCPSSKKLLCGHTQQELVTDWSKSQCSEADNRACRLSLLTIATCGRLEWQIPSAAAISKRSPNKMQGYQ